MTLPVYAVVDGALDTSFGNSGKVITDFGGNNDQITAVVIQTDGKIVAAGYTSAAGIGDFALARYNADGNSLDTGFGTGGKVTTDFGANDDDRARAMIIQPDGKIVVAGYATINSIKEIAVARYDYTGVLDKSFGKNGIVLTYTTAHIDDEANAIALQLDGKIVVAGTTNNGSDLDFVVVRYNSDGSPDNGFGSNGIVTTDIVPSSTGPSSDDHANSVAVDINSNITVAGYSTVPEFPTGTTDNFSLARYKSNGLLDTSFVSSGKTSDPIGSALDHINALAIQPNGQAVVAGNYHSSVTSDNDFIVARYTSGGARDPTFGTGTPKPGTVETDFGSGSDTAYAMVLQPDGKVLAVGYASINSGAGKVFALARYKSDGTPDTTFNSNGGNGAVPGTQILNFGHNDNEAHAAALQPDGKIVVAGYALNNASTPNKDFALTRYYAFSTSDVPVNPTSAGFTDDKAAPINSPVTSDIITLGGLGSGVSVPVNVSGGEYVKLPGTPDAQFGWAQNNDQFTVQHTSGLTHGDQVTTTLNVGGIVAANNYSVVLGTPTPYTFTSTVNQAPTISGTPATSVVQDTAYSFTPTASDPDSGDTWAFSIANKPTWASFDPATGTLSGTPTSIDVGDNPAIRITVTDNWGASASLPDFTLSVTSTPPPPAPSGGGGGPMNPLWLMVLAGGLLGMGLAPTRRR